MVGNIFTFNQTSILSVSARGGKTKTLFPPPYPPFPRWRDLFSADPHMSGDCWDPLIDRQSSYLPPCAYHKANPDCPLHWRHKLESWTTPATRVTSAQAPPHRLTAPPCPIPSTSSPPVEGQLGPRHLRWLPPFGEPDCFWNAAAPTPDPPWNHHHRMGPWSLSIRDP